MNIDSAYFILLLVSLGLMLGQLFVKQKQLEHIFFAIFCGSLAMVSLKFLSADLLGPYQYIIGLGTCATCNVMWLVSRSMFRGESSIHKRHIALALFVAGLVMISQALKMAAELNLISVPAFSYMSSSISEITQLMSSTVLVLTFWEAVRPSEGKSVKNPIAIPNWQRYLFAGYFASAVLFGSVGINALVDPEMRTQVFPWFVFLAALQLMIVTQFILYCQLRSRRRSQQEESYPAGEISPCDLEIDHSLITGINILLRDENQFLKHNLKMVDLANALGVSEYKVSRAIRYHFKAPNFNHFINSYRLDHAIKLMTDPESHQWSILVISMESGFSSITSFNRAFKLMQGCSPREYRLKQACA